MKKAFVIAALALGAAGAGNALVMEDDAMPAPALALETELDVASTLQAAVTGFDARGALSSYTVSKTTIVRDDSECGGCVRHVSEHIVREITAHIASFCSDATDPRIRAHCEWMAAHKEFVTGTLVARTRPAQSAFGYCVGTGACPHPSPAANVTEQLGAEPNVDVLEALNALFDSNEALAGLIASGGDFAEAAAPDLDALGFEAPEQEADGGCGLCVGIVSHHVVRGVLEGIHAQCESTECPFERRWCEWARENFDFFLGTLVAKVEPAKFGVGACIATHHCEHGGHGDHDGGNNDNDGGDFPINDWDDSDADGDSDGHEHHHHHGHHHGRHGHHHHGHHHGRHGDHHHGRHGHHHGPPPPPHGHHGHGQHGDHHREHHGRHHGGGDHHHRRGE